MGLKKPGHALAGPWQQKGQSNEIAHDPGNDEEQPRNCPKQALGGTTGNGFLVAGGCILYGEYVGAAAADKGAADENVQNNQRQNKQYAHQAPEPDEGRKVGKQQA